MKYLYGDATESPLDKNYIELLRDVLDFGVSVLLAHDNITRHRKVAADRQTAAQKEHEQLEGLNRAVEAALDAARKHTTAPGAVRCIEGIRGSALAEVRRADGGVQTALTGEIAKINEAIDREQANNVKRLETLLVRHDLPGCSLWVNARLSSTGTGYVAELIGKAPSEVAFVMDLEIPPGHVLSDLLRVEKVAPHLSIKVPEESGWVRKQVKMRAHKLGKEYVVGISRTTKRATIKLRTSLQDPDTGYDLIFGTKNRVAIARIAKGLEVEPYEPDQEDRNELVSFYDTMSRALGDLRGSRRTLRGAQLDGKPLAEHPDATVLVQRLIGQLAPIVQEIGRRSQSPNELVLKRVLADDRREEIFASKADLRAKLEPLPEHLRRMFDPLALTERSSTSSHPGAISHPGSTPPPYTAVAVQTSVEVPQPSWPPPMSRAQSTPAPPAVQPMPSPQMPSPQMPSPQMPSQPMFPPSPAPPVVSPTGPTMVASALADIPARGTLRMPQATPAIIEDPTAARSGDDAPLPLSASNVVTSAPSNPFRPAESSPGGGNENVLPEPTPPPTRIRANESPDVRLAPDSRSGRTLRPSSPRGVAVIPSGATPPSGTPVAPGIGLGPGATLPKPSAPPPRPLPKPPGAVSSEPGRPEPGKKSDPGQSASVDVELDELLNNE